MAYGLLALSVVLGLLVSSKLFGRALSAKTLTYLHEGLAVGSLLATITHLVALGLDEFVDFGLKALLVPGASTWEPQAVALGVVAMWMLVDRHGVVLHPKWIGQKVWRFVHFSSFGAFVAAFAHGIMAGHRFGQPGGPGDVRGDGRPGG